MDASDNAASTSLMDEQEVSPYRGSCTGDDSSLECNNVSLMKVYLFIYLFHSITSSHIKSCIH